MYLDIQVLQEVGVIQGVERVVIVLGALRSQPLRLTTPHGVNGIHMIPPSGSQQPGQVIVVKGIAGQSVGNNDNLK